MITMKNELHLSQNPYLLQHKDNPVAWHLWGNQAFDEAKQRDIPLLVSIGYSTCHWCHVMAHEVFEDQEAAAIMNDHLVCIKVDREEHPEVDEVYMEACQAMNGSGGWPLNVFVGHDGKPFFAVTYVARENWKNLVLRVSSAWKENRIQISDFAIQLTATLQEESNTNAHNAFNLKEQLYAFLEEHYDEEHPDFSGAGRAPRFPSHTLYAFLLGSREIPKIISTKLESVLEAIQDSGLHDRVGGGFHRYSTDREWRVPHFEKMLYDNAQLMATFALASSRYQRPDFLQTAENIASYLIRDMAVYAEGKFIGFACAEDADDPGGEGSFYAWTPQQLEEALGEVLGTALANEWNISDNNANVHGVFTRRIPHPRGSVVFQNLSFNEKMNRRLEWVSVYSKLLAKRQLRPRPFRDEKIVTETNALTLLGFSILYAQTLKPSYLKISNDLAEILKERFDGVNLQRLPGKKGHITDYGHCGLALFTAWEATFNESYLNMAETIVECAFDKFATQNGAIYSSDNESDMFMRFEEKYDHAQPSGAHSLLLAWERMYSIGKLKNYEPLVRTIMERRQKRFGQIPFMVASFVQTIDELANGPTTLKVPPTFMNDATELLKWAGTDVRLIPDFQNNAYQFCNKDRCLLPVKTSKELDLKFAW